MRAQVSFPADELRRICSRFHVQRLAIFGSAITERFGPESDVDVLVEFEPGKTPGLAFVALQEHLARLIHREVDLHTYRSLSPYFRDEVIKEAEVCYEP